MRFVDVSFKCNISSLTLLRHDSIPVKREESSAKESQCLEVAIYFENNGVVFFPLWKIDSDVSQKQSHLQFPFIRLSISLQGKFFKSPLVNICYEFSLREGSVPHCELITYLLKGKYLRPIVRNM